MYTTTRSQKPKLSLTISSAVPQQSAPTLRLAIPTAQPVQQSSYLAVSTPLSRSLPSPSPMTPTSRNTRANQRGQCTYQAATYAYEMNSNTKSILRRESRSNSSSTSSSRSSSVSSTSSRGSGRRVGFTEEPVVYCITPVSYNDGEGYVRMNKENRWARAAAAARYYGDE